jgi:archaellum component FlaF (FlaF/FlaG flagellin family)
MERRYLKKSRKKAAFTFFEVYLALIVFTLMALMVAAVIPMSARSVRYGNDYTQAATLAMHKVNQLNEAGYSNINRNLNSPLVVVDSNGSLPSATNNVNGDKTGSSTFTTRDNMATYFVGGVSDPTGTISIAPFTPSISVVSGVTSYSIIQATVTVNWRDVRGRQQTYVTRTLISKNPIL